MKYWTVPPGQFWSSRRWPFSALPALGAVLTAVLAALLLTQPPQFVIALVLGGAAFVLLTRQPHWGLYLMIVSVSGQTFTSLNLNGSRITFTQLAVLLALTGWLSNRLVYRRSFLPRPLPRLLPLFGLYLLVMLITLVVARNLSDGLNEMFRWAITAFTFWLAASVIATRRQLWGLVVCLCLGPLLMGVLGFLQVRYTEIFQAKFIPCADFTRACGTFDQPNSYAGYVEMGLPLIAAGALLAFKQRNVLAKRWFNPYLPTQSDTRARLIKYSGLLLIMVPAALLAVQGIGAAQSRGAQLGLAVAVAAMILARGKKSLPLIFLGGSLLVLVVLGLQTGAISATAFGRLGQVDQFTPFDVRDVKVTDENFAIVERMAMWQAGGNMVLSNPWLGVGIGNYNERYPDFNAPLWYVSRGHAHNYYIQAAAETGLLGLTAYLLLLGTALVHGLRVFRRAADPALRYLAWGAWGIIVAVAFHNLVEDLHVLNMGIQWSAALALLSLIPRFEKGS